jgi:hypothetical protein
VIVNPRTAVFVTRIKHVLAARAQEWSPAETLTAPAINFQAYYRSSPSLTSRFLGGFLGVRRNA